MSIEIDAREVLRYLNDLGYVDISQKQLKEFIRDLKKLIKYDQKKSRKENICPQSEQEQYYEDEYPSDDDIATQINSRQQQEYLSEVFDYLHRASTASSSAKTKNKKVNDEIISVQVLKPKPSRPLSSSGTSDNRIEDMPQKPKRPFSSHIRGGTSNVPPTEKQDKQYKSTNKTKRTAKQVSVSDSSSTKYVEAQNRPASRNRNKENDPASRSTRIGRRSPESTRRPFSFHPTATAVREVPKKQKSFIRSREASFSSSNSETINRTNMPKKTNPPAPVYKFRPHSAYIPSPTDDGSVSPPHHSPIRRRQTAYYPATETSISVVYPPPNTRKTSLAPRSADFDLRPTTTFIRTRKPVRISKSDPVTLYQQYQEEWKKQKFPGEDKRYDLRWAIRERMLGDPELMPRIGMEKVSRKSSRS